MSTPPPPLPHIGQDDWGEELNAYLAWVSQYAASNDTRISALEIRIEAVEAQVEANRIASNTHIQARPYEYTNSTSPVSGKINVAWAMDATALIVNDLAADGTGLPYTIIDSNEVNKFNLSNSDGTLVMEGEITGASVDSGGYRTWPITVTEVVGSGPANNVALTFYVAVYVDL